MLSEPRLSARVIKRAGAWDGAPVDTVSLDYDGRYRRRRALTADGGLPFLLDLEKPTELQDGDGLLLSDGGVVLVRAAPEPVADLHCASTAALVRLAWHLGNRHLPTQLFEARLRIRQDHVIEAMAEGLGAIVERLEAPFNPEGGAYGGGRTHGHAHAHGHAHGAAPEGAN